MNTIKQEIKKFIIREIALDHWSSNQKIMSENQLRIKFNCSRVIAREALTNLVDVGVIYAKKGLGYFVDKKYTSSYFGSYGKLSNSKDNKISIISQGSNGHNQICDFLKIDTPENALLFKKEYVGKNEINAIQVTAINFKNNQIDFNLERAKDSILCELIKNNVFISSTNIEISMGENLPNYFNDIFEKMGWYNNIPIEIIESYDEKKSWIERTIRITNRKNFKIVFSKRRY